ncbi:MAG: hypothetical protein UW69_C0064G0005 [Microgenomates group bacterium GW2011_GWA2_44_7]|nr:MAG: hypothetical protein UW69_C0064G0005 [Microgenomates group bacterium GW2011_GWA2_44_7]KKT77830.1 MAG: hypothetical protein UW73_C0011G0029 [Microgenomates group bacterium GW2011_GWB1_44_8]
MKTWNIAGLVLLGVLILAGVWVLAGRGTTQSQGAQVIASTIVSTTTPKTQVEILPSDNPLENMANPVTVSHQNSVFSPASVKIKAGQAVKFINEDTNPVWIASGPHPSHTNYPGFDALKGMAKGESYLFVFNKVGTWGYHNHLAPGEKGTVEVVE